MANHTEVPTPETPVADTPPVMAQQPAVRSHPTSTAVLAALAVSLRWLSTHLTNPRTRTALVGIALIVIAAEWVSHSVWTFPLVIIGVLMIVVAWVGSRLEGRFGIEWSEAGAGFEMRARFKSASAEQITIKRLSAQGTPVSSPTAAPVSAAAPVSDRVEEATVIEGEAHTIEIDVEELRALVAAAERATPSTATTNGTPVSWQETYLGADRRTEN